MNRLNARTIEHARAFLGTIQAALATLVSNLRARHAVVAGMTSPRRPLGRTSLAAASLLAISTLSTIASPATAAAGSSGHPGPDAADSAPRRPGGRPPRPRRARHGAPTAAQRRPSAHSAASPPLERLRHPGLDPSGERQPRRCDPVPGRRRPLLAARHAAVFGLSASQVDGLALVSSQKLAQSDARAVLFRQDFGGVAPALGGLVTVGVADGRIAYVSSSLARTTGVLPAATLTPLQGWLKAAADLVRRRRRRAASRHHDDA